MENVIGYNMITENIGLGDTHSDYEEFDIIVNLNYPSNQVEYGEIREELIDNKKIYKIGIYDRVNEPITRLLHELTPKFIEDMKKPGTKILFHCYAGVSRSATLAIDFIARQQDISLLQAFLLVKKRRDIIKPNYGFMNSLINYHNDMSLIEKIGSLHKAIDQNDIKLVEKMIEYGVKINDINDEGFTPLHFACIESNNRIIEILLEAGGDPNIPDTNMSKLTPFQFYIKFNEFDICMIDLFLKYGADINRQDEIMKRTVLHYLTLLHYETKCT
jgi:hypothetical protein